MTFPEIILSNVIDEISMGPFGSNIKVECFQETGIPVLNGSNLMGFKLGEESFRYVSKEKADSLGKANASKGDVVITHRGTLGQIVYIPQDSEYDRYVISQSQFRIRFNKQKALPEYIVYYFHTTEGQHRLLMNASQVGVPALARPSTSFPKISIPLPTIHIQQHIVDILSSLDAKIENNNKINAKLEEIAQNLFKEWFVDFGPFKDGKFVESELGLIPDEWRMGLFSQTVDIMPGGTPKTDIEEYWYNGDIPFFSPKDAGTDVYCTTTEKAITNKGLNACSSRLYPKNTIFITARGTVGKVVMTACDMAMNQSNYAIKPKDSNNNYYTFLVTRSITEKLKHKSNGAVFSAIVTRDFDENIIIPSKDIEEKFNNLVAPLFSKIWNLLQENQRLATLRDTLLPKLMSGEIEV